MRMSTGIWTKRQGRSEVGPPDLGELKAPCNFRPRELSKGQEVLLTRGRRRSPQRTDSPTAALDSLPWPSTPIRLPRLLRQSAGCLRRRPQPQTVGRRCRVRRSQVLSRPRAAGRPHVDQPQPMHGRSSPDGSQALGAHAGRPGT